MELGLWGGMCGLWSRTAPRKGALGYAGELWTLRGDAPDATSGCRHVDTRCSAASPRCPQHAPRWSYWDLLEWLCGDSNIHIALGKGFWMVCSQIKQASRVLPRRLPGQPDCRYPLPLWEVAMVTRPLHSLFLSPPLSLLLLFIFLFLFGHKDVYAYICFLHVQQKCREARGGAC